MIDSMMYLCFMVLVPVQVTSQAYALTVPASLIARSRFGDGECYAKQAHSDNTAERSSCRKFVGDFYDWYLAQSKNGDPLRAALRRKKANFSVELLLRLKEDTQAAARSPNEIVGLDFDPVLDSQDPAKKYTPGTVTQKDRRFLVEVFAVQKGKNSEAPAVTAELQHTGGNWVFTNFIYKADGKTDDLLSLLKRLKADRSKHR